MDAVRRDAICCHPLRRTLSADIQATGSSWRAAHWDEYFYIPACNQILTLRLYLHDAASWINLRYARSKTIVWINIWHCPRGA